MSRIMLPRDMEVLITSFGGVGTTFLLHYLARYKKTNHPIDADGLKHLTLPPISFNSNFKFVYVYGNPQMAVISLFRRNYQHRQSMKLQKWSRQALSPIPMEMTLQAYASQGIDRFQFRNHFYNWYDTYLSARPTLFIRYETIFDNVVPLLNFLDLPLDCIDSFPKKKSRFSALEGLPGETLIQLDQLYGEFSDELAKLDDVEVRKRSGRMIYIRRYLKPPYLRAFVEQGAFHVKEFLKKYAPGFYRFLRKMKP